MEVEEEEVVVSGESALATAAEGGRSSGRGDGGAQAAALATAAEGGRSSGRGDGGAQAVRVSDRCPVPCDGSVQRDSVPNYGRFFFLTIASL